MRMPRASLALLSLPLLPPAAPAHALVQPRSSRPALSRPFAPPRLRNSMGEGAADAVAAEEAPADVVGGLNHVSGVRDVVPSHSTFLLDMWGVMHDGTRPYDGALDAVRRLRDAGRRMVVLSNSSKRLGHSIKMLRKLGFDPDDFHQIITSGEVSHRMLSGDASLGCSSWPVLTDLIESGRRKAFVFGSGDGDEEYCSTAGWTLASAEEADLIVARGTFTVNDGSGRVACKRQDEDGYLRAVEGALETAARRGVPMLVTNPDRVRPDEGLPPMPGAIGDSYEAVLAAAGRAGDPSSLVRRIGKPFPEVYELALSEAGEDGSTGGGGRGVCMVGDALETDVTGGSRASCSTLWVVKDGIHAPAVEEVCAESYERGAAEVLSRYNEKRGYTNGDTLSPTFVTPYFRW